MNKKWLLMVAIFSIVGISFIMNAPDMMGDSYILTPSPSAQVDSYYREYVYSVEFNGVPTLVEEASLSTDLVQPPLSFSETHTFLRIPFKIYWPYSNHPVAFGDKINIFLQAYFGGIFNAREIVVETQMEVIFDYSLQFRFPNVMDLTTFDIYVDMGPQFDQEFLIFDATVELSLIYKTLDLSSSMLVSHSTDRLSFNYGSGIDRLLHSGGDIFLVVIILIVSLAVVFFLMGVLSDRNRENRRQSTQLAKSLIDSGIFTEYTMFATQIAEQGDIEERNEVREQEEKKKKQKHEGEKFETQIDANAPKKYYYIPGYYDTTVTFPRFILIAIVYFLCIAISVASLLNYFAPLNSPDTPFFLQVLLGILASVFVFGLMLYLAYDSIRLQKLSFRDIERAGYVMPKRSEPQMDERADDSIQKEEGKQEHAYATTVLEKVEKERYKTSRIIGGLTWVPMTISNIIIIVCSIAFTSLFAIDLFINLFSGIISLEAIGESMNLFEFINTLSLADVSFFAINILLVILLIKSIFIRQYNFVANISNASLFIFLYSPIFFYSPIFGVLSFGLLAFGIVQALFALKVVPRQESKSHHYTDLKKENHHYSNSRLYLAERLHSQRWYIYLPILCMGIVSILIIQTPVLIVNLAVFISAMLIDIAIFGSRKTLGLRANKKLMVLFMILGGIGIATFFVNLFTSIIIVPDFGIGLVIALKTYMTLSGNISNVTEIPKEKNLRVKKIAQKAKDRIKSITVRDPESELKDGGEKSNKELVVYFVTPDAVRTNSPMFQTMFKKFEGIKLPELGKQLVDKLVDKVSIVEKKVPGLIGSIAKKLGIQQPLKEEFGSKWKQVLATEIVIPELVDSKIIERKKMK